MPRKKARHQDDVDPLGAHDLDGLGLHRKLAQVGRRVGVVHAV